MTAGRHVIMVYYENFRIDIYRTIGQSSIIFFFFHLFEPTSSSLRHGTTFRTINKAPKNT